MINAAEWMRNKLSWSPRPVRFMTSAPEEASLFQFGRVRVRRPSWRLCCVTSSADFRAEEAVYLWFQRLCSNMNVWDDLRLLMLARVRSALDAERPSPSLSNDPPRGHSSTS